MADQKHKLRILVNTNIPICPSGYGSQAHDLLPLIRDEGYPLAVSCFYGLEGGRMDHDGMTYYPKIGDTWGADAMVNHGRHFKADVVISLQDIWTLNPDLLRQTTRWVPIVPIDHDPIPPAIHERLKLAYRIITMSEFGYNELKRVGLHSTFIQHTVDTEILKPMDKVTCRKELGVPEDMFVFGMVAANKDNPPRKSFQEAMDAFKMFHERHPKSGLFFHTLLNMQGGFPIEEYAKFLGIYEVVFKIDPYDQMFNVDRAGMAKILNTFDCLLLPSTSEGFGIPAIEAQACGVPVIVNNFTAMPEMVKRGVTGEVCDIANKRFTPLLSYVANPSTQSLYECMERIFKVDRVEMGKQARLYMIEKYELKKVFREKWVPFLERVEREVYKDQL